MPDPADEPQFKPCRKCQGTGAIAGFVVDRPCPRCDGTGRVPRVPDRQVKS